ncbi:MAG: nitrous oxide reductase accessory protein NosL [Pedobacter sp.]
MKRIVLLLFGLLIMASSGALAAQPEDVTRAPTCHQCGMDRDKFRYSRTVIEFLDGSTVANCSLHCAAVELATSIDRIPVKIGVADYNSKAIIDADDAFWVLGGNKKGVMTNKAKWAFAEQSAAKKFIQANGGSIVTFDEAIKAAYEDMYLDTKMIREFRMMMRSKHKEDAHAH